MEILSAFLVIAFAVAFWTGFRAYRSSAWHLVDLAYYPLAEIGVALLFANTTAQRKAIELAQAEEASKAALTLHMRTVPNVSVSITSELVDASTNLIATIPEFANACRYPGNANPRCLVAERLAPAISDFLLVANARRDADLPIRLASACIASDRMVLQIQSAGLMSSLVADEFLTQYRGAIKRELPQFTVDALMQEIHDFESRASMSVNRVSNALADKVPGIGPVLAAYGHEIEFGKLLLQGLLPCITVPRAGLEQLNAWTRKKRSQEESVESIKADREHLINAGPAFPTLSRLHLFIWPYVLIVALALKFAKGVATVRKHNKQ